MNRAVFLKRESKFWPVFPPSFSGASGTWQRKAAPYSRAHSIYAKIPDRHLACDQEHYIITVQGRRNTDSKRATIGRRNCGVSSEEKFSTSSTPILRHLSSSTPATFRAMKPLPNVCGVGSRSRGLLKSGCIRAGLREWQDCVNEGWEEYRERGMRVEDGCCARVRVGGVMCHDVAVWWRILTKPRCSNLAAPK